LKCAFEEGPLSRRIFPLLEACEQLSHSTLLEPSRYSDSGGGGQFDIRHDRLSGFEIGLAWLFWEDVEGWP